MGTLDYMAPEQCLDIRDADIRSDLFSVGATLFRMFTGKPLWGRQKMDTAGRKMQASLNDPIPE